MPSATRDGRTSWSSSAAVESCGSGSPVSMPRPGLLVLSVTSAASQASAATALGAWQLTHSLPRALTVALPRRLLMILRAGRILGEGVAVRGSRGAEIGAGGAAHLDAGATIILTRPTPPANYADSRHCAGR